MAEKNIWQKIKNWLSGGNRKQKQTPPQPYVKSTTNYKQLQGESARRAYINTMKGKDVKAEMRSLKDPYKATKYNYANIANNIDKDLNVGAKKTLPAVDKKLASAVRKAEAKDAKKITPPTPPTQKTANPYQGYNKKQKAAKKAVEDAIATATPKVAAAANVALANAKGAQMTERYKNQGDNIRAYQNTRTTAPDPIKHTVSEVADANAAARVEHDLSENKPWYWYFLNESEQQGVKSIKKRRELNKMANDEFNEMTNHKYDVKYWEELGDEKKAEEARQLVKGGFATSDPAAEYIDIKYRPKAYSAVRGFAAGATLDATELFLRNQKDPERVKLEQLYQENKSKGLETAGELAGSMATFVVTAPEQAGARLMQRLAPNAAERLGETNLVKWAAKRSVNKAVNKGLVTATSEELIAQVGKKKALKIINALGMDIIQNLTTGAIYDINRASTEHEVGSEEWWKALAKSAALNWAITGGVAGFSAAKGSKTLVTEAADDIYKQAQKKWFKEGAERLQAGNAVKPPRWIGESIDDKIARIAGKNADEAAEAATEQVAKGTKSAAETLVKNADETAGVVVKNIDNVANKASDPIVESIERTKRIDLATGNRLERLYAEADGFRVSAASGDQAAIKRLAEIEEEIKAINEYTEKEIERRTIGSVDDAIAKADWEQEPPEAYMPIKPKDHSLASEEGEELWTLENGGIEEPPYVLAEEEAKAVKGAKPAAETLNTPMVKRKPTKTEQLRAQLLAEQESLQAQYKAAQAAGGDVDAIVAEIKNNEAALASVERKIASADKARATRAANREALQAFDVTAGRARVAEIDARIAEIKRLVDAGNISASEKKRLGAELKKLVKEKTAIGKRIQQIELGKVKSQVKKRTKEIASGEPPTTKVTGNPEVNTSTPVPKAVRDARSKFEEWGGKVEKGTEAPTFKEQYDAYKDYVVSQGTDSRIKQSKAAATQIRMMTETEEKALRQKLVESGGYDYETIFTPELYNRINQEFKVNGDYWTQRILDGADDLKTVSVDEAPFMQARAEYLMAVLDPKKDPAIEDAYLAAMKLAKDISSKSGQALNIRRNFVRLTPAGRMESVIDDLYKIVDGSQGFNKAHPELAKLKGKYDRMNYIKGVLMDDPEIEKAITKIANAKNADAVSEYYTELMYALNKNNPKSAFDVVQEWRYFNMLANPKTHIRNVFGSAFFAPIRQTSNMTRSLIESHFANKAGLDIVKHGGLSPKAAIEAWVDNPTSKSGKMALEALERRKGDLLGSSKFGQQMMAGRGKTFAGKTLDTLSDFNSHLLTIEDDFFKSRAFRENYIKMYERAVKDGTPLTEQYLKRIEDEAILEAQIATFNEYNEFANWLSKLTRKAYDANESRGMRWFARGVNAFMPFEKVPANLMKQSINYSPLGLAKGYANIVKATKAGDAAALNRAIDELASGLTGTAIFSLGTLLGLTTHAFTTNVGKNDPAAKFKKQQGVQNYSVTFTDPISGKKKSITLDWLVPTSSTFFAGVELANEIRKGGLSWKSFGKSAADWATVSSRLIEPVMESSMLSGLHSTLETLRGGYGDDDDKGAAEIILREGVQNWIGSLFPTLGGQLARTLYSSDKQMPSTSDWEYFRNQLKLKTGLAGDNALTNALGIEPLGAETDAYGNVRGKKETAGDYVRSFIQNAILPWNTKEVDLDEVDEQIIAEYERRVKAGEDPADLEYLFPKKQSKKEFKVGGEIEPMTNVELSTYNQAKTTGGSEAMYDILNNSIIFNRYDYDEKGNKVPTSNAYTEQMKADLIKQFDGKSLREVQTWLYNNPLFQSASEAEQKKAIEMLWKLNRDSNAKGAQKVGGQAVYKSRGKDVDEYNFYNEVSEKKRDALQPYIDSGVLTYSDIVNFVRAAGKISYTDNDEGGGASKSFSRKSMLAYFDENGIPYDTAKALYDVYFTGKTPYDGNNSTSSSGSGRGYGRRRYRGGGGGSRKIAPKVKQSLYKATNQTYKDTASMLKTRSTGKVSTASPIKVEPPTVKFKKYEV